MKQTYNLESIFEKLKDMFMFKEGSEVDNYIVPPQVTTGYILWGILLRTAIIIIASLFVVSFLEIRELWWFSVFVFWFTVAYPAYRQYNKFQQRVQALKEDTICGKCEHFFIESQLCSVYDEHVGSINIPCNGEAWECRQDTAR